MTSPLVLMKKWRFYPKKQLGQNFLSDPSTAEMVISRSGVTKDDIVLEIGAGLGALTIPIAKTANFIYAVEKDHHIIPILEDEISRQNLSNVSILKQNILELDIRPVFDRHRTPFIVLGNLPYNISSQVLVKLINDRKYISRAYLMFQKEFAVRIAAGPGGKDYGRISVMLGYCADVKSIAQIKSHLFTPKPKVDSEVLEIKFKNEISYPAKDELLFFNVIKAGFGKRRKTIKNALSQSQLDIDASTAQSILEKSGIAPSRRAETLSIEEFVTLSNELFDHLRNT